MGTHDIQLTMLQAAAQAPTSVSTVIFQQDVHGFRRGKISLGEDCKCYSSGRIVGRGIAWTRTAWTEASNWNTSFLIWYARNPFVKFAGTWWIMCRFLISTCSLFITEIPNHAWRNSIQSTIASGAGRRNTSARPEISVQMQFTVTSQMEEVAEVAAVEVISSGSKNWPRHQDHRFSPAP
jgi:hypothetical protein